MKERGQTENNPDVLLLHCLYINQHVILVRYFGYVVELFLSAIEC